MYAVIVSGGKQYRVSQGDVIYVEKLDQEVDSKVSFDVLMLGSDEGVEVGTPTLAGAKVEGKVLAQVKAKRSSSTSTRARRTIIARRATVRRIPRWRSPAVADDHRILSAGRTRPVRHPGQRPCGICTRG